MQAEEKKANFFLCCFCGIKIHSNRFNLDLHEKLHGSHVSKIKCAAKGCDSILANKSIYWRHWTDKHSRLIMPDFLIYVDVPPGRSRQAVRGNRTVRGRLAGLAKRTNKVRESGGTQMLPTTNAVESSGDKHHANRIESSEEPNIDLKFDIEKTIQNCLLRDPHYGCLNYSSL